MPLAWLWYRLRSALCGSGEDVPKGGSRLCRCRTTAGFVAFLAAPPTAGAPIDPSTAHRRMAERQAFITPIGELRGPCSSINEADPESSSGAELPSSLHQEQHNGRLRAIVCLSETILNVRERRYSSVRAEVSTW